MANVSWNQWVILKNLSILKDKTPTYRSDWARRVDIFPNSQTWTNTLKILKENDISEYKPWISNYKIMKINIKKLDKFIENTNIYKNFKQYVYLKQILVAGV